MTSAHLERYEGSRHTSYTCKVCKRHDLELLHHASHCPHYRPNMVELCTQPGTYKVRDNDLAIAEIHARLDSANEKLDRLMDFLDHLQKEREDAMHDSSDD